MATSIEDFDYGSVVDEIRGQTRSRKPKFLKRYGGEILSTLIGVADNYQTYKLREKMDEANFENNIELAKIRADAAKHIKRSKETSGQYDRLLTEGFQFDKESTGSQQNLNAARKVFGDQAWNTVSSQFPNLIPRHNFKNYQDYEDQRASWGMNEESHKAVENLYNSIVMDKANYVRSGQAFDFEQFNVNLKSLEDQGITIDPDNYGLLSKIGGKLARNLEYQQEQIAAFRNRYLTDEVQKGVKAMEQWTGSQTPEQYYEAVKNTDLGIWASLSPEDAGILTELSPGLKQEATDALQKVLHRNPNMSRRQFNNFFNSFVFGDQGRTPATAQITLFESQERKAINADTSLTEEQKIKAREETSNFYDKLKVQASLYSEDQVTRLIGAHNILRITEERMEPLIKLKEEGKLGPEEKRRLEQLQQNKIYAETTIEYIDSPQSRSDRISEEREKDIKLARNDYLAQAYINDFYAQLDKNTDVSKGAHAILTDNDVLKILRENPRDVDEQTFNDLMKRAVTPIEFSEVNDTTKREYISNLTSNVRIFVVQALQGEDPNMMFRIFNTTNRDKVDEYKKFLGASAASDTQGAYLSENMTKIAQFEHFANQVFDLSKDAIDKGQHGFFYGNLASEQEKREIIMDVFIENFTFTDTDTDKILVKSSSLGEVADAIQRKFVEYKNSINTQLTNAQLLDQAKQNKAEGNFDRASEIEAFVANREKQEADKLAEQKSETKQAIRQRNYERVFGTKPSSGPIGVFKDMFPALKDEGTSDIPDEKKNKISDEETESLLGGPTKEVPISTDDMGELLRGQRSGIEFDAPAANIVEQVAAEVSELFNDGAAATALLRETAIQESNMGQAPGTYKMVDDKEFGRGSFGVGQVDEQNFEDTMSRLRGDKGQPRNLVKYVQIFKDKLGEDLTELEYEDLIDPKLGLIFTRLHYLKTADPVPPTVQGRAEYWKKFYNTSAGAGTPDEYLSNQESYAKIYGKE